MNTVKEFETEIKVYEKCIKHFQEKIKGINEELNTIQELEKVKLEKETLEIFERKFSFVFSHLGESKVLYFILGNRITFHNLDKTITFDIHRGEYDRWTFVNKREHMQIIPDVDNLTDLLIEVFVKKGKL